MKGLRLGLQKFFIVGKDGQSVLRRWYRVFFLGFLGFFYFGIDFFALGWRIGLFDLFFFLSRHFFFCLFFGHCHLFDWSLFLLNSSFLDLLFTFDSGFLLSFRCLHL